MNKYISDLLRRRQNNEEGFTLVELLIVIIILGILAAVVVFSVAGVTKTGKKAACRANVSTLASASEAYRAENGSYAATILLIQTGGFLNNLGGVLSGNSIAYGTGPDYTVTYHPTTAGPILGGSVDADNSNCDALTN